MCWRPSGLHGDDTTVPILAKGKTDTGRAWVYVRDDRPFGGASPPAALFYASRDRSGEHPERHLGSFTGILQADAYGGYNRLYLADRKPGPVTRGALLGHARRKFFVLADIAANARRGKTRARRSRRSRFEAVKRIDALFDIERDINGLAAERAPCRHAGQERAARRRARSLDARRAGQALAPCRRSPRPSTTCSSAGLASRRFLEDGRICLTNNAAERALRGLALGRKSWLFAGSDRGAERAAVMYTLIVHRQAQRRRPAGLARRRARPHRRHAAKRLAELLPWNWRRSTASALKAA